ncbi:diiron oxygenase [Streptomyces sp. NPDC005811]|uniref:diiron oxygenase n=1 Tax=Streptomyces sp. NPDC005811 TaxID=3154565 RepID=UPI0033CC7F77
MCGTVGMFVGCSALMYCPRRLLQGPGPGTDPAGQEEQTASPDPSEPSALEPGAGVAGLPTYRSPFRTWYERSSVRSAPRRLLVAEDGSAGLRLFPPDLVPVTRHPLVRALPAERFQEVLVQHLYRYLDFTAKLEYLVVNRTVLGIARGSVGVSVPDEMRLDAFKMYCDEAYHTLFSADLAMQVRHATGIAPRLPDEPFFLRRLQEILDELPTADRPLAELLFVIVSETLISASLAELPQRDEVASAVTGTIRDHALDEGRHHAYFAHFLQRLWAELDPAERRTASRLVPRLMDAFLRPDLDALREELTGYGLSKDDAEQVLAEVYTPKVLGAHFRATSQQTRRYFHELGAFDDPMARAALAAHCLLD